MNKIKEQTISPKDIFKYFFLLVVFILIYPYILSIPSITWAISGHASNYFVSLGAMAYVVYFFFLPLYLFIVIESVVHAEPIFNGETLRYTEKSEKRSYLRSVLKNIGFFKTDKKKPVVIGVIWLAGIFSVMLFSFGTSVFFRNLLTFWVLWRILLFSFTSLAEEIMFRYGLFKHMRMLMKGKFWPYVISSAVFAAMHFYSFGVTSAAKHVVGTFSLGLILAWIYESADYSIYPSWIVHMIGDVVAFSM